jgi:hypothetical protein
MAGATAAHVANMEINVGPKNKLFSNSLIKSARHLPEKYPAYVDE